VILRLVMVSLKVKRSAKGQCKVSGICVLRRQVLRVRQAPTVGRTSNSLAYRRPGFVVKRCVAVAKVTDASATASLPSLSVSSRPACSASRRPDYAL